MTSGGTRLDCLAKALINEFSQIELTSRATPPEWRYTFSLLRGFRVQWNRQKKPGRKEFGAMLRQLHTDPHCRTVMVGQRDMDVVRGRSSRALFRGIRARK